MASLYRKYRPQTWESVIGQNHIKLTLQKELETAKLAHAYLFAGPRGVGKTSTARILAKALNCERRGAEQSEPCNECPTCQSITAGRSIDVLEIDAASNTGVENVRENIIDSARFMPTQSKFKIFIIDEVHMLSTSAFNALLKTLEEPPAHVFFILATTESGKLPATIVSRCQRFDFKKVAPEKIAKHLKTIAEEEGFEVEKSVLDQLTHLSEGCLRDAESLLEQILSIGEKKITAERASLVLPRSDFHRAVELLQMLFERRLRDGMLMINRLLEDGVDLQRFCEDIIEVLHLLLLARTGQNLDTAEYSLEEEFNKKINSLAGTLTLPRLTQALEVFSRQKTALRSSSIPQLPLELALVELVGEETITPPQAKRPTTPPATPPVPPAPTTIESPAEQSTAPANTNIDKTTILEQNTTVIPGEAPPKAVQAEESISPISITLEEIRARWHPFIKRVQDYNHSLPFVLKMGEPIAIEGHIVKIAFKYTFHRDKLNESRLRQLAEKALNDIFGNQGLGLEGVFVENTADGGTVTEEVLTIDTIDSVSVSPTATEQTTNATVEDLLKNFGGQVVD